MGRRALLTAGALVVATALTPVTAAGAGHAPHRCFGQDATIVGTADDDDLTGTDGVDVVWLGGGRDYYENPGGRDRICGGAGTDTFTLPISGQRVNGGRGNDQIGWWDIRVRGGLRTDVPAGRTSSDHGADTRFRAIETFNGTENGDVFIGGPGDDFYSGMAGFDRIRLGAGDDDAQLLTGVLRAGPGDDHVRAQWGPLGARARTELSGGSGDDWLLGTPRRDRVSGGPGADQIEGSSGDDRLRGDGGRDDVRGDNGVDRCSGEQQRSCERPL